MNLLRLMSIIAVVLSLTPAADAGRIMQAYTLSASTNNPVTRYIQAHEDPYIDDGAVANYCNGYYHRYKGFSKVIAARENNSNVTKQNVSVQSDTDLGGSVVNNNTVLNNSTQCTN